MRVADLFRRLYKSFGPLEIAEFNPLFCSFNQQNSRNICFWFPGFVQTSILPTFGDGYLFAVMRPNDRELTSSLIQTVNWNYVLNRANEAKPTFATVLKTLLAPSFGLEFKNLLMLEVYISPDDMPSGSLLNSAF